MNYTESYEVRRMFSDGMWDILGTYDSEHEANSHLDRVSSMGSGVWRVVRVSEVTVGSMARA